MKSEKLPRPPFRHSYKTSSYRSLCLLIAMLPVTLWGIYLFGARVITLMIFGLIGGISADILICFILSRFNIKKALSRTKVLDDCVISLMVTLMLPASVPFYLPIYCAFFAIFLFRELVGSRGNNLLDPAFAGIMLTELVFAGYMGSFVLPFSYHNSLSLIIGKDHIAAAECMSPLQLLIKSDALYEDGIPGMFLGIAPGKIGEVGILMLIAAAIFLTVMGISRHYAGIAYVAVLFAFCVIFPKGESESSFYALAHILSGSTIFIAVFGCSNPATTPRTFKAQLVFGALLALMTYILRSVFVTFDGAYLALLLLNLLAPYIDELFAGVPYGVILKKRKGAANE